MDTILLIVTFLSLAMAVGMGLFVATLLREERRRSDARVAALTELAAEPTPMERAAFDGAIHPPAAPVRQRAEPPVRAAVSGVSRAASLGDLEIRPPQTETASDLFVEPRRSSPWGRRLAIITPMAIVIGIGLFGATVRIDSTLDDGVPAQEIAVTTPARSRLPLELLSLRHTHRAGSFTVAGVVQNPREAASLSRIAATVVLFGSDGAVLANGRAPLDFTTLAPGGESPFVIEVPVAHTVTRYRIGFRGEGGQVIEHVDRRAAANALARK